MKENMARLHGILRINRFKRRLFTPLEIPNSYSIQACTKVKENTRMAARRPPTPKNSAKHTARVAIQGKPAIGTRLLIEEVQRRLVGMGHRLGSNHLSRYDRVTHPARTRVKCLYGFHRSRK